MKKIILLAMFFILTQTLANAAIRVSPSYVEIDANKTKRDFVSGSFTVSGGKDEVVRFKVYPNFFERGINGTFVELEDKGQKNSLVSKIKFYPQEFTCKDGAEQKVRFTISDVKSLPSGDSRLVLFLEDTKTREVVIQNAQGGSGGKLILKTRIGVPVYVDKGMYNKKGTLDAVSLNKQGEDYICNYRVSSNGNSRIRYGGFMYISHKGELIKKLEVYGSTVEAGSKLEKKEKLDLLKDDLKEGEDYKIKFVLTYKDEGGKEKILKKEFVYTPGKEVASKI